MADPITFELSKPTILLNPYLRMHFRERARYRKALAWEVKVMTHGRCPAQPFDRARVTIIRRSTRIPDRDGMVGGCKALIDCLLPLSKRHPSGLGFIVDDNPAVLDLVVEHLHVTRPHLAGTHVTIQPLEVIP